MSTEKNNRVLSRTGARGLTEQEANKIAGGVGTETFCTAPNPRFPKGDGDPGECGWN